MTDRNEMKGAAELVLGNPDAHTPTEVALAGMLLELVEAPIRFNEYDGTVRYLRLDAGEPDAGICPSYVVDEGEADAFKRNALRLVELEFAKGQCERWHTSGMAKLAVGAIAAAGAIAAVGNKAGKELAVRDPYWLDKDNNKHAIDCHGYCGLRCRERKN